MKDAELETVFSAIERIGPRSARRVQARGRRAGRRTRRHSHDRARRHGRARRLGRFRRSPEAADGADHPLDRWSRRVIEALARELGAKAFFPFGGPPFWPFQQWARRAEPVHPSPIGLLIHPRYGLWHSYRGALGLSEAIAVPEPAALPSPCESCSGRWCLSACPVGAFSGVGYDVAACVGHLKSAAGADCMEAGCRARRACPVGAEHAYGAEQANFTMRAFLRAQEG